MDIALRLKKVNIYNPRLLSVFIWVISLAGIVIWLYLMFYILAIFKMPEESQHKALAWCVNISRRLAFITISASSLYVLIKAQHTRATLYFAFFFSFLSLTAALNWLINIEILSQNVRSVVNVMGGISIILLVRFIQEFPERLAQQHISQVYTGRVARKFLAPVLIWFLKSFRVWLILLPIGILISVVDSWTNILVIICSALSLGYLYVQLNVSQSNLKNRLYWLIWMLCLLFFSSVISILLPLFDSSSTIIYYYYLPLFGNISILVAFLMIVYFSDLIDARLILQKTVIFGAVIFIFTFVFGATEHFVIHKLAHFLHINDIYVASTLACALGMCFHPLKEKLTHWLKRLDKGN